MGDIIIDSLSAYSTTVQMQSYVTSQLASYVTSSALTTALANYSTTSAMQLYVTSQLASYVTSSALTALLASYPTTSAMNSAITAATSSFQTAAQVTTTIDNTVLNGYNVPVWRMRLFGNGTSISSGVLRFANNTQLVVANTSTPTSVQVGVISAGTGVFAIHDPGPSPTLGLNRWYGLTGTLMSGNTQSLNVSFTPITSLRVDMAITNGTTATNPSSSGWVLDVSYWALP